ncbi:MAG TPA: PIG-L deacetylase family protein [Thermodesulfovibrionales bacterium]|nr:PIG-L deacetylase family protein [Thermodesulfovibrionales bacterium]
MSELDSIRHELRDIERALVLSPHPDDETLGCGGTMARYSGKIDFTVAALSNGEAVNIPEDNRADLRRRELSDALGILGIKDRVFLDIPDGKFSHYKVEIREKLSELITLKNPQMIFSPSPLDLHEDHRETALACIEILEKMPSIKIAFYEIYNPIRFNTLVDISGQIEIKKEALARYHYSLLGKEDIFIASVTSLNRFRSLFALRDSYYEAFWMPAAVVGLTDALNWLTCNVSPPTPEDRLLSSLRVADSLVHEFRTAEDELKEKTETALSLSQELRDREETIRSLQERLRFIETSLSWKLVGRFRKIKSGLLPEGTQRRRLYDKVIGSLKNSIS